MMNLVSEIIKMKMLKMTHEDRVKLKLFGRPTPVLKIKQDGTSNGKSYRRNFKKDLYDTYDWICGCAVRNKLFCFPCLLFGVEGVWTTVGVSNLQHLGVMIKKHEVSRSHLSNVLEFKMLGVASIQDQLIDSADAHSIRRHNELVAQNRVIVSSIINIIRLCGEYNLPLGDSVDKPDLIIFGLLEYTVKLDPSLQRHINSAAVSEITSAKVITDLIDCIFQVYQNIVASEINQAKFLSVIADRTPDGAYIILFRYELNNASVERFWKIVHPMQDDAENISQVLVTEIEAVIGYETEKLIAQSYDGTTAIVEGSSTVQAYVQFVYPNAHLVHSHAHNFCEVIEQVASDDKEVRIFFTELAAFPAFFTQSQERAALLEKVVRQRVGQVEIPPFNWDLNLRPVNTVYELIEDLPRCFTELEGMDNVETTVAASLLRRLLQDSSFLFWLTFLHYVMPSGENLRDFLQKPNITSRQVTEAVNEFLTDISKISEDMQNVVSLAPASSAELDIKPNCSIAQDEGSGHAQEVRVRDEVTSQAKSAMRVCDAIRAHAKERFQFTGHFSAASLLSSVYFYMYAKNFPTEAFAETLTSYPFLDQVKLRTELEVLYSRTYSPQLRSPSDILKFLKYHGMEDTLPQLAALVRVVMTTPIVNAQNVPPSTLKDVRKAYRSSFSKERSNGLTVLAVGKQVIAEHINFNEKVLDIFVASKNPTIQLTFKNSI